MTTWTDAASALLAAAGAVEVPTETGGSAPDTSPLSATVARVFVAPGPRFAHDCSLLAVHAEVVRSLPLDSTTSLGMEFPCLTVPAITLVLTYAEDCVPGPANDGNPPAPDVVSAWSLQWYERVTLLWQGVMDAVMGGALDSAGCYDATVGDARMEGPLGLMAWVTIPVTVRLQS